MPSWVPMIGSPLTLPEFVKLRIVDERCTQTRNAARSAHKDEGGDASIDAVFPGAPSVAFRTMVARETSAGTPWQQCPRVCSPDVRTERIGGAKGVHLRIITLL